MTYEEIKFTTEGPIGILTLNNPKKINALSKQMIQEVIDSRFQQKLFQYLQSWQLGLLLLSGLHCIYSSIRVA